MNETTSHKKFSARASALAVAAGILLSRIVGLVRDRVFAHYFGNSDAADAFRAAFRIPNFLQNLFGEGVLSASFIPVYARLRAEERHEEASQLAEAIFALLFLAMVYAMLDETSRAQSLKARLADEFRHYTAEAFIRGYPVTNPSALAAIRAGARRLGMAEPLRL